MNSLTLHLPLDDTFQPDVAQRLTRALTQPAVSVTPPCGSLRYALVLPVPSLCAFYVQNADWYLRELTSVETRRDGTHAEKAAMRLGYFHAAAQLRDLRDPAGETLLLNVATTTPGTTPSEQGVSHTLADDRTPHPDDDLRSEATARLLHLFQSGHSFVSTAGKAYAQRLKGDQPR